ncbi:bacteriochlorophyll 4-vinyl reductase [Salibaculum sp.]|uniref:bacteriochlorophyll 4-vinyl reductase n=1 Tax=Salibaculum sp. TaxID=2855480 RepID=UPI002B49A4AF|nr:bacteriochlorophyll 4-vinyl reductase [Salibaculum sp.]HKL70709.1 bacteriochlorophyll 4-vinyl reductase [Salibaculum sp.]
MQPRAAHHVGPNAILQTVEAVQALAGQGALTRVCRAAAMPGLVGNLPHAMVPAQDALRLHQAVARTLPGPLAGQVARDAGRRTGDYILAHRIPAPARVLLRLMPGRLAGPVLLKAIGHHAWTFAGDAEVTCIRRPELELVVRDNPLALPGCPWHRAVLERLFQRLVDPCVRVEHTACCAIDGSECRFVFHAASVPYRGG